MTVAELLEQARAAHQRYRQHAGRINREGKISQVPQLAKCGDAVREALRLRAEAEQLDRARIDPAWAEDAALVKASHDDLVAMYVRYLSPPEAFIPEETPAN